MALFSERTESCGKKVLDRAGVIREAIFQQLPVGHAALCGARQIRRDRPL
jgi:hypothetical protein